jgi:hypothetical protein
MRMDPITIIVAALAAGAAKGLTDTTTAAVGDLYTQLRSAIQKKFQGNAAAQTVLDEYVKDPDTYAKPMAKQIAANTVEADEHILDLAQAILENTDPAGSSKGKYNIDARGVRNLQAGDHGVQHNA